MRPSEDDFMSIKMKQDQEEAVKGQIMENINVQGKEYHLMKGNPENVQYRASFNALTEKTFGFNFEQWNQGGYWTNQYLPYSILDGNTVVSNVSVNLMDFDVCGKPKRLIQLGTVMTDDAYRNQGLSRVLMDMVIKEWKDKGEAIYLFANDSVLSFYPKFGFHAVDQYQYTKAIRKKVKERAAKKLNMSDESHRKLVYEKAKVSSSMAKISMVGNAELIMFYCIAFMKDSVYYLEEYDTVVVAHEEQGLLEVFGVFCKEEVSLDLILDHMAKEDTKRVRLCFTPKETESYQFIPLEGEGTLFILGNGLDLFGEQLLMFPLLSHA